MNEPRIFVIGGWRWEPKALVDDWVESFRWADKVSIVDDRKRKGNDWIDEGEYRILQRKQLEKDGIQPGDWVLISSPDERMEVSTGRILRKVIAKRNNQRTIFSFHLKEMFTPDEYRTDGLWGRKKRPRFYPYLTNQEFSQKRIQQSGTPKEGGYKKKLLDVNIYHLKMIEPENRETRVKQYKEADPNYEYQEKDNPRIKRIDPEGKFERMGYDYMTDLDDMTLETIPKGREYYPDYKPYKLNWRKK